MRKKLIPIMLLALVASVFDLLLFSPKEAKAVKPIYLDSCTYDANGKVISYTCDYEWEIDLCSKDNC
jgi:hypothetical protein